MTSTKPSNLVLVYFKHFELVGSYNLKRPLTTTDLLMDLLMAKPFRSDPLFFQIALAIAKSLPFF